MSEVHHTAMAGAAEFDVIRRLIAEWGPAASGIGDDAAVIVPTPGYQIVVSTDSSVENVHFRKGWLTAEEIGARAAAAALSDLAAMGAIPRGLLLAIAAPPGWSENLIDIGRGVAEAASALSCPIVGGNLTSSAVLSLTCTVVGETPDPVFRSGAQEGDIIFVTGTLGAVGRALKAFESARKMGEEMRNRFARPTPRIREGIWLRERGAHSAIDVSDGLLADAGHLGRASGVTLAIDSASIPRFGGTTVAEAANSGEEYELLITAPRDSACDPAIFLETFGLQLTPIGVVKVAAVAPVMLDGQAVGRSGFDHFVR